MLTPLCKPDDRPPKLEVAATSSDPREQTRNRRGCVSWVLPFQWHRNHLAVEINGRCQRARGERRPPDLISSLKPVAVSAAALGRPKMALYSLTGRANSPFHAEPAQFATHLSFSSFKVRTNLEAGPLSQLRRETRSSRLSITGGASSWNHTYSLCSRILYAQRRSPATICSTRSIVTRGPSTVWNRSSSVEQNPLHAVAAAQIGQ